MHSLLTEEIQKFNLENKNLINNKDNLNFQKIAVNIKHENDFEKKIISNIKNKSCINFFKNEEYSINMNIIIQNK